jgi:PadR family transcriptional regulator, regulatory protein PadR
VVRRNVHDSGKGSRMRVDLLQGTLDMLILKALTSGPKHGYGVTRWLEQTTGDALKVEEGSLYPALHRMAKRGWVKAEWGVSENNRRAKYYTLTAAGRVQLRREAATWSVYAEVVSMVLMAEPVRG